MANEKSQKTYFPEVARRAIADTKGSFDGTKRWLFAAIEALIGIVVIVYFLDRYRGEAAVMDFIVQGLFATPFAVAAVFAVHLIWHWAQAPRRVFYEQRAEISQHKTDATSAKEKLEAAIQSHASELQRLQTEHEELLRVRRPFITRGHTTCKRIRSDVTLDFEFLNSGQLPAYGITTFVASCDPGNPEELKFREITGPDRLLPGAGFNWCITLDYPIGSAPIWLVIRICYSHAEKQGERDYDDPMYICFSENNGESSLALLQSHEVESIKRQLYGRAGD